MKIDRNTLMENLANYITNRADLSELEDYYYQGTYDFLDDLSDEELLEQADWVGYTDKDEEDESNG